jgi:hypothetical protein
MKAVWCCIILFFLLLSCTTREVSPTRESRIAIDSIYQAKILEFQGQLDTLCRQYMDSVYRYAVDSMLKERQDEINRLVK